MSRRRRPQVVNRPAQADVVKATVETTLQLMGINVNSQSQVRSLAQEARQNRVFGFNEEQATQFSPGVPPPDQPLAQTPDPRTYAYRVGWNYPSLPGEGRPVDYQTMRDLANVYDLLRKAIEIRKDEITSLTFDVIARDPDKRKARTITETQQGKINEIRDFFAYPDRRHTYQAWMRSLLEEHFVTDAVTLWKWKDYGGNPVGYRILDGTLMKPLIDVNGNRPMPPDPAYQQYVYGVPRWRFTSDELMWCPKNVRVNTPYGFSPVEQFLLHINGALRFERWAVDYFTDGTIPEGVAEAPASWTKQQIQDFNTYWDSMIAGDTRALRKLKFVAAGFKFHQLKPFEFNMEFAYWLVYYTCAAMDVTPIELGFEPLHGGLGGRGLGEEQSTVLRRKSTKPLLKWLKDEIFNPIIWHDFKCPDLQAHFKEEEGQEDEVNRVKAIDTAIRNGSVSIDQIIEEGGGEPVGIGRLFAFGNQVLGEPDLLQISKYGARGVIPMGNPNAVAGGNQASNIEQNGKKPAAAPAQLPQSPMGLDQVPLQSDSAESELEDPLDHGDLPDEYTLKAARAAESTTFMRFFRARRKAGEWRDFRSRVFPEYIVDQLNDAGKAGLTEGTVRKILAGV